MIMKIAPRRGAGGTHRRRPALAEGERVGLGAGVEEADLEGVVGDAAGLADELIEPRLDDRAVAGLVGVGPVRRAGRLPVDERPEPDGRSWRGWSHHEVEVA